MNSLDTILILTGLTFISQAAFMFFPGRQPVAYYICVGAIPPKFVDSPIKFNLAFYSLLLFSCVAQLFVIVRVRIFKCQGQELAVQGTHMNNINKESLFRYLLLIIKLTY